MNEISKIKAYPYGSYLRLHHKEKDVSIKVLNPENQTIFPRAIITSLDENDKTRFLIDARYWLSEISKPVTKLRITKPSQTEADKYRKIIELKNSNSQDLETLNKFFSDMRDNIYQADASAIGFLKFLKSPQGDYLATNLINKALFHEAFKIEKDIKGNQESEDKMMKEMASDDRVAAYIDNSTNLANRLGEVGLENLAYKLIEKIDDNIDTLNKKYHWISAQRLDFATLALRNSNDYHNGITDSEITVNNLNLDLEEVLEIFKQDLDATKDQAKDQAKDHNPKLVKLLKKFIDNTQFKYANATSIRDFYIDASIQGYQEEANQVLMKGIAAQNEDPHKTKTQNVYILDKLFAFAVKEKLIENPAEFIQDIQEWREGAKLPKGFNSISSILNPSIPLTELPETTSEVAVEIPPKKNKIIDPTGNIDSKENEEAETGLLTVLIQIRENLGVPYFKEDDLPRINEAIVDHLKAIKEKDFKSFTQLLDQIINIEEYPELADEIFNTNSLLFHGKPFSLFDLSYLLGYFTDNPSEFKKNLFKDYYDEPKNQNVISEGLPSVSLSIKNFDHYNRVFKTNAKSSLAESNTKNSLFVEAFKEKLQTTDFINAVIDKLPLHLYSSKEIAINYFALCDEGHINNANHLLNKKFEQLNNSKKSQEKYHEYADILELFGYAKSKGLISEGSLNLDNKVLKTYSKIIENPSGKLEKGFDELLEIIRDEKMNQQCIAMLVNQLTGGMIQDDNNGNTASHSVQTKVKQPRMSDEQKELFMHALRQRIFLNDNETEVAQFQIERQKEKKVNELSDLLKLSNQLLSLKIFNAQDIEHLRKDYGDWNIIRKIYREDISGIFNTSMQESLFSKIPEYKLDNNKNNSPLYILIDKAFESTRTLGNFDKLSKLLNETLKETPIFPGNVKNDLKLSLMIFQNFVKPSSGNYFKANENNNSPENLPQTEPQTDLTLDEVRMNRLRRKRSRLDNLSPEQKKARKEERRGAREIRDRDFQGRAYAKPSRLLPEITKPLIYQAALEGNKNLLETALCRIFENYEILKRRYENFPADEIDKKTLQLALSAEKRLLELEIIDKRVFADKITLKL